MATKYQMPQATAQAVDGNGRLTTVFQQYFRGIEDMSGRISVNVAPLAASPTNAQIATAFNSLLTALQNAGLQEEP